MSEETFETPQVVEPKTTNWPKIILVAVLGPGLLAAAAYTGYWYGTESANLKTQSAKPELKTQNQIKPTPTPTPSVENETEGWKTYTDSTYGFSVKYPPDWVYQDRCEGGTPEEHYPCFHSQDFEVGLAGVVMGNPTAGGEIILDVFEENETLSPLCPENLEGYKFPCLAVQVDEITGWRSVIPKSSPDLTTYPVAGNTIRLSFVHNGKRFTFTGYYNDESKSEVQSVFDQILSTFKFLK